MKSKILLLLRERGDYVSGQEICEKFQVSRTAVWKAINQLKKEGYCIEAVPNRGYQLVTEEEIFGQHELESRMHTRWAGHPVRFYEVIGSTNIQAKLEAEEGAGEGLLVVADKQTAGRGRRGRAWSSPSGCNVYYTLLLKPAFRPDLASMVTLVMAMAVTEGIRKTCGKAGQNESGFEGVAAGDGRREADDITVGIKWPNDIVIDGKKVCGMLTEMSLEKDYIHYVVIGVGINVIKQEYAPEIASTAICLEEAYGKRIPRAVLVANIMQAFESYYEKFCEAEDLTLLLEEYNRQLVNKDRQVRVLDPKGEYEGVSKGINANGELLVETKDGKVIPVYAGEVSVRGIYGYV